MNKFDESYKKYGKRLKEFENKKRDKNFLEFFEFIRKEIN